jgi:hypothetical protein
LVLEDNNRAKDEWEQCLTPYLKAIVKSEETIQKVADQVITEGTAALSAEKADPEDEEEDLCNAQFSLAYGIVIIIIIVVVFVIVFVDFFFELFIIIINFFF